jgi:hypothetical protein
VTETEEQSDADIDAVFRRLRENSRRRKMRELPETPTKLNAEMLDDPATLTDRADVQADAVELTSDIGRDAPVDPIVEAANAAFARVESHRKLFRRDWLPFLDGVYHLSLAAWERAGRRTRLDGKPDWNDDRVQDAFREEIEGLPWEHYFEGRRTLLSVLRKIGGERARFLRWYDALDEVVRERVGHPETLWGRFDREVLRKSATAAEPVGEVERDGAETSEEMDNARRMDEQLATIRELEAKEAASADRIRELESEVERLRTRVAELERELARHRAVEAAP